MPVPDPDRLLSHIRRDILTWEKADPGSRAEWEAAECATSDMAALDKHLTEGGKLPRAWQTIMPRGYATEPAVTGTGNLMGIQPVETGAPVRAEIEWDDSRGY